MKVVIAIDSFKGSLTSLQAGESAKKGILRAYPDAEVKVMPIADGGEGTLDAVTSAVKSELVEVEVTLPTGDRGIARYGILEDGSAFVEVAEAVGLTRVPLEKRDPMTVTSYGLGELLFHAIKERGCRRFTVGLGGSATNDGGIGMLEALGYRFAEGRVSRGAMGLREVRFVDDSSVIPELSECHITLACDVKNALCGDNGCSKIFALQKGAGEDDLAVMDEWMSGYADVVEKHIPTANKNAEGSGAAGGLGFAFMGVLGARMRAGIEVVAEVTGLESEVSTADVIVTGEGRLDGQSVMGKAPVGVASVGKKYSLPVIALSGCVREDATALLDCGIDAYFPIVQSPCTLEEAMEESRAMKNLEATAYQVFRLMKIGGIK
ncbi:MAG: glycerate kinase [Clostridia bacterium]|nr:glycerate kinase [Clostridia bacterium]